MRRLTIGVCLLAASAAAQAGVERVADLVGYPHFIERDAAALVRTGQCQVLAGMVESHPVGMFGDAEKGVAKKIRKHLEYNRADAFSLISYDRPGALETGYVTVTYYPLVCAMPGENSS